MKLLPAYSLAVSLLALALTLTGCRAKQAQAAPDWSPMVTGEMGEMQTVAYAENLWFGSRPDAEALRLAQRRGVERVIDLSGGSSPDLMAVGAEVGLRWVTIPLPDEEGLLDQAVDRVLAEITISARTLMFSDDGGASAALFAIHRVVHDGVPVDAALAEARRAGLIPERGEAWVRREVARLTPHAP